MKVKCDDCGKEYGLEPGENPSDYQCECGGGLKKSEDNIEVQAKPKTVIKEDIKSRSSFNRQKEKSSTPYEKRFCKECGAENRPDATFCYSCGKSFKGGVSEKKGTTSRMIELVLGILGGVFGLFGGVFALIFAAFAPSVGGLGISAVLASIVGIGGAVYVTKNSKYGGIILIVSAIWLLFSISAFGVLGSALLGIAGLLALLRK